MDTAQSTETVISSTKSHGGHEFGLTSPPSSSSSSLTSLVSSASSTSLNKIDISHGIPSVKLEELLKNAHTSLGVEHYEKPDHHAIVPTEMTVQEQADQDVQTTKLHSFGPDNDDVRDYPHHGHIRPRYACSVLSTSGSSLASFLSGYSEPQHAPFFPDNYSEVEHHPSARPILTLPHQPSSRLPKMSRPVRVTLSASNKNYQAARYKTELCLHFREHNTCPHGDMCLFAHGLSELRPYRGRHPKHKTQPCRSFHQTGFCNYGYRCSYIHLESPETIKYLRGLNINKAQEEGCTNLAKVAKCEIGLNSRDRVQFKHK